MGTSWLGRENDANLVQQNSHLLTPITPTILRSCEWHNVTVRIVHGDLATENVDIIVNETNTHLIHA